MHSLALRAADWDELEGKWQDLVRQSFHEHYIGMGEAYAGVVDAGGKIEDMLHYTDGLPAWAAWDGERLAGFLMGRTRGERLVLFDLFVAPSDRRRGIGRGLVELAIRESGARVVTAEVNRQNAASQALFKALGFQCEMTSDWLALRPDE
jgi:ribosomal protein S18 acetylase RimI-like enzyme